MKSNKIIILILVVLAAVAIYFFINKSAGTLGSNKGEKSDFAITNIETIDKIFIVDSKGKSVTLTKPGDGWLIDGKHSARPDNIRLLMKTFKRTAVRSPVPKTAHNNVIKQIATIATKVEIYQGGDKPSKIYYVGGSTLDHQGTYMILETEGVKSSVPFIMYIPGNYGYLTSRFFTDADQWRDAIVFKYQPEEIKSITINYFETPEESFVINKNGNKFSLSEIDSEKIIPVDSNVLHEYVSRYQKIYYEQVDEQLSKYQIDSILSSPPFRSIEVNGIDGAKDKIVIYHMPNFRGLKDPGTGIEYDYDIDRMYGSLNNDLFIYIQFPTFDKITFPKRYFKNN
ncbi:MAG: hypothetical protein JKY30_14490 [Flavobacteriales bacterium]|nr:hypothetical protein [Flavobacteriales bacterium]